MRLVLLLLVAGCGRFGIGEQPGSAAPDADPAAPDADPAAPDADPSAPDAGPATLDARPIVVACGPNETPGPFQADFESGLPAWAGFFEHSPGRIRVEAGALVIEPDRTQVAPAYWGMGPIVTGSDLRGHRVAVEVTEMVETNGTAQVMLLWTWAPGEGFELFQSGGQLRCASIIGSSRTESVVTYVPASHRWWQLREDGGQVRCEASADGQTWTTLRSVPTPAALATADVELTAGMHQPELATPGTARFDNLVDCVAP